MTIRSACLCLGLASVAVRPNAAFSENYSLSSPPSCPYADMESSVNVPLPNFPEQGRHVQLTFTAAATATNAVQIAFGRDKNGDEDLEPEETEYVVGVDCGQRFIRDERTGVETSAPVTDLSSDTHQFEFRQSKTISERFTHAKVTSRGPNDYPPRIDIIVVKRGMAVILK